MARLIDADALGIGKCNPDVFDDKGYAKGWNSAIEILQNASTVDAVPVVRCRECKWGRTVREGSEYVWCGKPYAAPWSSHVANWYCADGKRKEDTK